MVFRRRQRVAGPKARTGHDGTRYRSGFELAVAGAIEECGVLPAYEAETYKYQLNYVPDFAPTLSGCGTVVIEAKGYFPVEDRSKVLAVLRSNPNLRDRYYLVFQNPRMKVTKTMTASEWATRHNIRWATVDGIKDILRP